MVNITTKNTVTTNVVCDLPAVNFTLSANDAIVKTLGTGWEDGGDGYFYYTSVVAPNASTQNLFSSLVVNTALKRGQKLSYTYDPKQYILFWDKELLLQINVPIQIYIFHTLPLSYLQTGKFSNIIQCTFREERQIGIPIILGYMVHIILKKSCLI